MSSPSTNEAPQGAHRIGRRVGSALFWLLLVYVISMSAISIVPSLYFPKYAPRPAGEAVGTCAREIDSLERDLVEHTANALRSESSKTATQWLAAWDARHATLPIECGPLDGARKDLGELRLHVESLLQDYARGPMRTSERIRRALQSLPAPGNPKS